MRALLLLLMTVPALAQAEIYTYTGSNYVAPTGSFTTSMHASGWFETSAPLPPSMAKTNIGPAGSGLVTDWSFNDGLNTFTPANSMELYGYPVYFSVSTDANGDILDMEIGLMSPLPPHVMGQTMHAFLIISGGGDFTETIEGGTCLSLVGDLCSGVSLAANSLVSETLPAGTWVTSVPPAPGPSTYVPVPTLGSLALMLLVMAMLALGLRARARAG